MGGDINYQNLPAILFDPGWQINIMIGCALATVSVGVLCIVGSSCLSLCMVPFMVSACTAICDGLRCLVASSFSLSHFSPQAQVAVNVVADLCELASEAGMPLYLVIILRKMLARSDALLFHSLFWLTSLSAVGIRLYAIICTRLIYVPGVNTEQPALTHRLVLLQITYYFLIACADCLCACFLMYEFLREERRFVATMSMLAVVGKMPVSSKGFRSGLSVAWRSREARLASLAVVGTLRALTYTISVTVNVSPDVMHVLKELDGCAETLSHIFPVVFIIDLLLATKTLLSSHEKRKNGRLREMRLGSTSILPISTIPIAMLRSLDGQEEFHADILKNVLPTPPKPVEIQIYKSTEIQHSSMRMSKGRELWEAAAQVCRYLPTSP